MPFRSSRIPLALAAAITLGPGCPEPDAGLGPAGGSPGGAAGAQGGSAPNHPDPGATRLDDARFKTSGPDTIAITGNFTYEGSKTGSYRIDFLTKNGNAPPQLVHTVEVDQPGPWEIRAPRDFGDLHAMAFIDLKGDGPTPDDPSGRTTQPIAIGADDITGVELLVSDKPELGDLTPGANDGPPPPPPMMPEGSAEGPPPSDTPQGTPATATGEVTPPEDAGAPPEDATAPQ